MNRSDTRDASDSLLLCAVANRDEVALAILLTRHHDGLRTAARRWTRDPHLAEVVVADVGLVVWQDAARFQPRGSVRAWIYGIARNKSRALLRSHSRRLHHEMALDLRDDDIVDPLTDPQVVVLGYPANSGIGAAVRALPVRLREPLQLLFDQRFSYAEIAAVLDLPVGTVRRRIFEARARIMAATSD